MKKETFAKVVVVGLGYVGLPLAELAQERGFEILGVDPFKSVDTVPYSETLDVSDVSGPVCFVIAVPTPVSHDKIPDLTPLISASRAVGAELKKGDLVIVESTVAPGMIEEEVLPVLLEESKLSQKDFGLGHCPERINPGDPKWHVGNIPRVVGVTEISGSHYLDQAVAFYEQVLDKGVEIIPMTTIRAAEAVKAIENTMRDICIAFTNAKAIYSKKGYATLPETDYKDLQFARSDFMGKDGIAKEACAYFLNAHAHAHGLLKSETLKPENDIWPKIVAEVWRFVEDICGSMNMSFDEVKKGMASKPFGYEKFEFGCGVGGHCIAVDPYYLMTLAKRYEIDVAILEMPRLLNETMPIYTVKQYGDMPVGTKVGILGLTYKPNVADMRESPSLRVVEEFKNHGYITVTHDPLVESDYDVLEDILKEADVFVVTTAHDDMLAQLSEQMPKIKGKKILDGRNRLSKARCLECGVEYVGLDS